MATIGKVVLSTVLLSYIVWRILFMLEDKPEQEQVLKVNKPIVSVIGDKCDDGNPKTTIDLYVDRKGTCQGM